MCLERGMPVNIQFKQSVLALSMRNTFSTNDINKLLCASVFLSVFSSPMVFAQDETNTPSQYIELPITQQATENNKQALETAAMQQGLNASKIDQIDDNLKKLNQPTEADSLSMLQQQEQNLDLSNEFKPIEFEDLDDLPMTGVDSTLANEILQVAEQAKVDAQNFRSSIQQNTETQVEDVKLAELTEISQAPIDVNQLMQTIEADSQIVVAANESGQSLVEPGFVEPEIAEDPGFFKRIFYKVRPPKVNQVNISRISAEVAGAPAILANNIKAKLSSFTTEAFSDFNSAVPQLRSLSQQAAQAVGYYDAEFKFAKTSDDKVKVTVIPHDPVIVREQNIEFSGAGEKLAQLQVIKVLPELSDGDIFDHGKYEATKTRIVDAASNNGFFDAYWRLHDVKVARPQNEADINLKYETGTRYKVGEVQFKMSDPSKELPIDEDILKTLAPWKEGADYTAWRVNTLANNLTNSRYFNYTLVDAVKPDPIIKPLELAPDLQALVDQENISASALLANDSEKKLSPKSNEVTQSVTDEKQFAGVGGESLDPKLRQSQLDQKAKETENERLQAQARDEKKIPVIVTLNADRLNSLEAGIGYGTDTGVRLRSQYRRAIVNKKGHSFDANLELSQIRQSFDGRYNIPYKHPLNDYISLVGGYEREDRDSIGNGLNLIVESAVAGADRIIKGSRRDWQHIIGMRYRLDRMTINGELNENLDEDFDFGDIPDSFLATGNEEQQSLLLGYEATKTTSDSRLNPTRGFKQNYKIQLGSESLLSDADMVIANANWKFLYSLGDNSDHQFIGGANLGYIFTKDFEKVPYNLRFFAGGDQSLRGFDYKSLSPESFGFKVGGQALAIGTLEYNYQFKEGWRAAVFSDFGNAYDEKFSNDNEYSLGLGIRWSSPIGPIRLDVASGVSDPNHPIRLHFFIGSQL